MDVAALIDSLTDELVAKHEESERVISGLQASLVSARASANGARVEELEDRIASLKAQLKKAHTMVRNQQDTVTDALMIGATRALRSALTQLEAHSNGTGMAACFTVWARLALGQGMSEREQQLLQLQQQQRQQQQLMESTHSMLQQERAAAESARAQVAALSKQLREERLSREGAPAVTMNEAHARRQVGASPAIAQAARSQGRRGETAEARHDLRSARHALASARCSPSVASAVGPRAATAVEGCTRSAARGGAGGEDVAEARTRRKRSSIMERASPHLCRRGHACASTVARASARACSRRLVLFRPRRATFDAICLPDRVRRRIKRPRGRRYRCSRHRRAPSAALLGRNHRASEHAHKAGARAARESATVHGLRPRCLRRAARRGVSGSQGVPRHIAPGQLTSPAMRTASAMLLARVS